MMSWRPGWVVGSRTEEDAGRQVESSSPATGEPGEDEQRPVRHDSERVRSCSFGVSSVARS